jgi:thiamine-phosphate pyrophosphorylase
VTALLDAPPHDATGAVRAQRAARLRGLHVLADDDPRWARGPLEQARAACRGGAAVVQLRAKHAADAVALAWAEAIRAETRAAGALFVVNDRFDLALASGADGVHLGQEDLPPARLPASALARLLVGRSTHTWEEALAAAAEPVDYVAFGPLFPTTSKASAHAACGLELLREVAAQAAPRPVVAIGGIDAERAAAALHAGAAGVAVISAVAGAEDAEAAVRELVAALACARLSA